MARRIVHSKRCSPLGFEYEVDLISSGAPSSLDLDYDLELSVPGFELTYQNGVDDVKPPIITSSVSIDMLVPCSKRDVVAQSVYEFMEFNLICVIKINGARHWVGIVHSEEFSETINEGDVLMSFTASDGLAQLKNIDFKDDDGSVYTGFKSYVEWIYLCLSKLPHYSFAHPSLLEPFLSELYLPRYLYPGESELTDNEALLGHIFLHGNGFYAREELQPQVINGFERVREPISATFISTYDVLYDLMSSLSATICYSEGKWVIFDRAGVFTTPVNELAYHDWYYDSIEFDESTAPFDSDVIDLDSEGFYFISGATRKGVYPYYSISQTHTEADNDLLIGDGVSFWDYRNPWSHLSRNNVQLYTRRPIFQYSRTNGYTEWPGVNSTAPHLTWTVNDSRYDLQEVAIPSGDDGGVIDVKFGGAARFTEYLPTIISTAEGAVAVFGFMIEVSNGINSFRLKRPVRTLKYTNSGETFAVDIIQENENYYPKFLQGYEWVRDDEEEYNAARLEILIGADPTILEEGVTDRFLSTDYPTTAFFTPPRTKVENNDNVLKVNEDKERANFVFRFHENIDMPNANDNGSVAVGNLTSIKVHSPIFASVPNWATWNLLRDQNGNALPIGNTVTSESGHGDNQPYIIGIPGTPSYETPGGPFQVAGFALYGFEMRIGDGNLSYSATSRYIPDSPQGLESASLSDTSFGSTFVNYVPNIKGKIYADHTNNPDKRDNLKWFPFAFNGIEDDYNVRLGNYACQSAMQIRGVTQQYISGSLNRYSMSGNGSIIYPYSVVKTGQLNPTSIEYFIPFEYALTPEGYRLGLLRRNVDRVLITGVIDEDKVGKGDDIFGGINDGDTGGTIDALSFTDQELANDIASGGGGGGIPDDIFPIFINR